MNKRGFAFITIVYAIILLIVSLLYMLLGIMRNRYNISDDLRKSIMENLNNESYINYGDSIDTCLLEIAKTEEDECNEEKNNDIEIKCIKQGNVYEKYVYKNVCIQDENMFTN